MYESDAYEPIMQKQKQKPGPYWVHDGPIILCKPDTSGLLLGPLKGGVSVKSRGQIFYSVGCRKSQCRVSPWCNYYIQIFHIFLSLKVGVECQGKFWMLGVGIFCPQSRVSGNVRCRNNPFHGPSWWMYCVPCVSPVVLLQLPSYCLPTTWCTSFESSLKILDLDTLTYDLWHWPFESLTDSRLKIGIFNTFDLDLWPWPLTLTFDLDLCDLDPHNIDLYIEPLILILG